MTIKILEQAGLNPSFWLVVLVVILVFHHVTQILSILLLKLMNMIRLFDKRSKLIHYDPSIFVINNIEFDHADIFKDIDAIFWQFHQLLRKMPSTAKIIYNAKNDNVQK